MTGEGSCRLSSYLAKYQMLLLNRLCVCVHANVLACTYVLACVVVVYISSNFILLRNFGRIYTFLYISVSAFTCQDLYKVLNTRVERCDKVYKIKTTV